MQTEILRVAQYILKHPILNEKEKYKRKYINVLEYFVRKYSTSNLYSFRMLELYKCKLLSNPKDYSYTKKDLKEVSKGVLAWKLKKFKFLSYRYCLLIDVIFICSYLDAEKSEEIYREFLGIYKKNYWKKLDGLFDFITGKNTEFVPLDQTEYMCKCLEINRRFLNREEYGIMVTANMSAGKSTLLNAIIGKKVNKTQNDTCTAKTHLLFNKAFEDNLTYEYDYELELDASYEVLMDDNEINNQNEIYVGTRFRSVREVSKSICFIDTPGVNSSQDKLHREISEKDIVEKNYEKLIYVMNGENLGTDDEYRHLQFVADNFKGKVIFVVNKLDRFRKEDSIPDTINQVKKDLENLGYKKPEVCPVSAYAGYLAKMSMFGVELNDDEIDELDRFYRKLKKEEYQLNKYYPEEYQELDVSDDPNQQLLLHSGILSLEEMLYEER